MFGHENEDQQDGNRGGSKKDWDRVCTKQSAKKENVQDNHDRLVHRSEDADVCILSAKISGRCAGEEDEVDLRNPDPNKESPLDV